MNPEGGLLREGTRMPVRVVWRWDSGEGRRAYGRTLAKDSLPLSREHHEP